MSEGKHSTEFWGKISLQIGLIFLLIIMLLTNNMEMFDKYATIIIGAVASMEGAYAVSRGIAKRNNP